MAINFPTSLDSFAVAIDNTTDVMAADINDVRDAIEVLEAKVGITSSGVDTSLDYKVNNFFVENTRKILFYENTAPTGWEIETTLEDKVVMVTKGSGAGGEIGGAAHSTGSWTISGLTDSGHTHGAGSYAGPNHTHTLATDAGTSGTADQPVVVQSGYAYNSSSPGGGHPRMSTTTGNPSATANTGTSASGTATIASAGTWRPAGYNCIIGKYTGA